MGRVFVTGDKHGDFGSPDDYFKVREFCERFNTTKEDFMIVLGDHGVRYFDGWKDIHSKKKLAKMPIRFILLHGNHDMRPQRDWKRVRFDTDEVRGWFIEDPDYPDILYTEEFGWYTFGGERVFVICGAYSIDKNYRLAMHDSGYTDYRWFADEQLSDSEKREAQVLLFHEMISGKFSVMAHTCPLSFKPFDKIDGADESTEAWMDMLYQTILTECRDNLNTWYCGHWHIDKIATPVRFMYHDILQIGGDNHG